jgi:hypothetical protein
MAEQKADDLGPINFVIVWGGRLLAISSSFLLVQQVFTVGLSAPFELMFQWYDSVIQLLGEIVRPLVEGLVEALKTWMPRIELNPDWKHWLALALGLLGSLIPLFRLAVYEIKGHSSFLDKLTMSVTSFFLVVLIAMMFIGVFINTQKSSSIIAFVTGTQFAIINIFSILLLAGWLVQLGGRRRTGALVAAVPIGAIFLVVTNAGLSLTGL